MTTFQVTTVNNTISVSVSDRTEFTLEQALGAVRQFLEAQSVDPKFTPGNVLRYVSAEGKRTSLVKVEEVVDAKHFRGIDLLGTLVRAGTSFSGWATSEFNGKWELV